VSDYLFPTARQRRDGGSQTVTVEVGRTSAWLRGYGLAAILDEVGVPRMWDWHPDRKRVLMCPSDRVDDVLAILDHRDRRVVELVAVDR
jgi:hypothetical protein